MRIKSWKWALAAGAAVLVGNLLWQYLGPFPLASGSLEHSTADPSSPNQASRVGFRDQKKLPAYIGKNACAQCHANEVNLWKESDHAKAMAHANDSTVLGNFNKDSLVHHGTVSRFYKQDGKFFVHTKGGDGIPADFQIKFTFGIHPLQQYLVEFPGGRLQCLPLAWDAQGSRWFHLSQDQNILPDDWLHWTRDGQNWNGMCSDCHSTGLTRNYSAQHGTFQTEWKEIDVSCEACHGPGGKHAMQAASGKISKWLSGYGPKNDFGLLVRFADSSTHTATLITSGKTKGITAASALEVAACARCHSRRMALRTEYQYHPNFLDEFLPEVLRESVYHPDGQILEEDYEYGSFLQSKMYQHGIRCSDCHDPHSLKVKGLDNGLCTRCHEPAKFDATLHHQHLQGSPGSLCINCHMPTKTYMQVDVRRDHSLRIPRPDQSVLYGTPNACSQCHTDKSASWAAEWVVKWHGTDRKPHFSDLLTLGHSGRPGSDSALLTLAENRGHPPIARATALHLLSEYMSRLAPIALLKGAQDPDPLVRQVAAVGLQDIPESERITPLLPLLVDSILAVRIAAANALMTASPLIPDSARANYHAALAESRSAMDANAYFPGGRFNLGQYYEKQGVADSAVLAYSAALDLDNRFIPARINLAQLLDRMGRTEESKAHFRASIHFNPEYGDAYYFLGLLLAGQSQLDSAVVYLELASLKLPRNPRIHYNFGLVLQKLGRLEDAANALQRSLALTGEDPEYLYTLAWLYTISKQWNKAMEILPRLAVVAPQHPGLAGLLMEASRYPKKRPRSTLAR